MTINGTFIVWGDSCAPQVHMLTKEQSRGLAERVALTHGDERQMMQVMRLTFGPEADGAMVAYAAHDPNQLEWLALNYQGPYQTDVKGIAAALALGQPVGGDAKGKPDSGPDNGSRDRITPRPKPPKGPAGSKLEFFANVGSK